MALLFKLYEGGGSACRWGMMLQLVLSTVASLLSLGQARADTPSFTSAHSAHMPDYDQVIHDVDLEPHHVLQKRSLDHHLRVHLHYDDSFDYLYQGHRELIKGKVEEAVRFWQSTLKLRPTAAPVRLNRKCRTAEVQYANGLRYCRDGCELRTHCGDTPVPDKHLHSCHWWDSATNVFWSPPDASPGEAGVDYILYVAAVNSYKCQSETVAFAAHCQLERALDRPIAGYINICPESVSTSIHKHEELLYTIKHEILHALGFTAGLFAFYRDSQGWPLTPRDPVSNKPSVFNYRGSVYQWSERVVRQVTRYGWRLKGQSINKLVNLLVTPKVIAAVRSHFGCIVLEGAELEDQGINGTAYTHWEKRLFENEFMTGTYTQNPIISRITLALMEDTGWYASVYENAGELEWGRNLGCDFVMKSCYEWIETRINRGADIHPFCVQPSRGRPTTDCTRNRKAVAICNLSEYKSDLPLQYQYFGHLPGVSASDVGRYGGGVALADYCPYLQEFVWKQEEEILRGSHCALPQNSPRYRDNFLLEAYSSTAKCFNHGSSWNLQHCTSLFQPHSGSGCYEYSCDSTTGLTIYVAGRDHRCHYTGQQLIINYADSQWYYRGNITCPACQEICQEHGVRCPAEDPRYYETPYSPHYDVPCAASSLTSAKTFTSITITVMVYVYCSIVWFR